MAVGHLIGTLPTIGVTQSSLCPCVSTAGFRPIESARQYWTMRGSWEERMGVAKSSERQSCPVGTRECCMGALLDSARAWGTAQITPCGNELHRCKVLQRHSIQSSASTNEAVTGGPSLLQLDACPRGVLLDAQEIVAATGGKLGAHGPPGVICTDTRILQPGDWFLALSGPNFDGQDFIDKAAEAGCAGVIVQVAPQHWSRGLVVVPNTLKALQDLGAHVRKNFSGPVVGITGSSGKTTTRAMIGLALGSLGYIHETAGNLNNHVGVPLTLLAMPPESAACVLELGMNRAGEIAELAAIGAPSVRVVLNVGPAHLEGLGSIEAVARAKGEIFEAARAGDICVVNEDDPLVAPLPIPVGAKTVRFGASASSDVRLLAAESTRKGWGVRATLEARGGGESPLAAQLELAAPGRHLALNACAAAAVAVALGVPLDEAVRGIGRYAPVGMRLKLEEVGCLVERPPPRQQAGIDGERGGGRRADAYAADDDVSAGVGAGGPVGGKDGGGGGGGAGSSKATSQRMGRQGPASPLRGSASACGQWASNGEEKAGSIWVIDDAYNANPMSVKSALRLLMDIECPLPGKRVALLGDMLELGNQSEGCHMAILECCAELQVDVVGVAGAAFLSAYQTLKANGWGSNVVKWCAMDSVELAKSVCAYVSAGDVVLVKGSRALRMEKIVEAIKDRHSA